MNNYKREILIASLEQREREVTEYQVNIDNFSMAMEEIGEDEDLQDFKEQLKGLLKSSLLEQKKSQIMLNVIRKQLEGNS